MNRAGDLRYTSGMSFETYRALMVIFGVWAALVTIKTFKALNSPDGYTFSMWDGGMLRAGKRLTPMGVKIKSVTAPLMCVSALVLAGGIIAPQQALYAVIGIAAVGVLSDFINTAS